MIMVSNQLSPSTAKAFEQSQRCLRLFDGTTLQTIVNNNCTKINSATGSSSNHSSPFFCSLAGRILRYMHRRPNIWRALNITKAHLMSVLNTEGLIGFLFPNRHRYDLDTLACAFSFLYQHAPDEILPRLPHIKKFFVDNKCSDTGGYFTWIGKRNNNIDFMVNINIRMFLKTLGVRDPSLDKYLWRNVDSFLAVGSHYYSDITFPVIITHIYLNSELWIDGDQDFVKLLKRIHDTSKSRRILHECNQKLHTLDGSNELTRLRLFPQYCNSRDSVFHSEILDCIICRYWNERSITGNNMRGSKICI